MTVNCRDADYDVYVGRSDDPDKGKWGNPYTHMKGEDTLAKYLVPDRITAIRSYVPYLLSDMKLVSQLPDLYGKTLGCWCKPMACHGDVLTVASEIFARTNYSGVPAILFNSQTVGYSWLSNFSQSRIEAMGMTAPTLEHMYQALKAVNPADAQDILSIPFAADAKRKGGSIQAHDWWESGKLAIMYKLLMKKFSHKRMRMELMQTDDAVLVHFSPWDKYWGVDKKMQGRNMLGKSIMLYRELIKVGLYD